MSILVRVRRTAYFQQRVAHVLIQELFQRFVALAMEFVKQRKTWKATGKRRKRSDVQYAEFPKSWSTRAEIEWQEVDYMFRNSRRHLRGQTQFQGTETSSDSDWQTPPTVRATAVQRTVVRLTCVWEQYRLYQHEEMSMQRMYKRRVMVVSNPDPADDSDGEFEIDLKTRL